MTLSRVHQCVFTCTTQSRESLLVCTQKKGHTLNCSINMDPLSSAVDSMNTPADKPAACKAVAHGGAQLVKCAIMRRASPVRM